MPAWSPVCVLWKQSALWVFYPTHQAKPGAPQKRGDWAKFTHAQILNYTHTHTHEVCTCSKLSNAWILRIHAHTYGVHCHAPSCENLDKCMNSSTSLSTVCLLCWPLSPSFVPSISSSSFVPSSFRLPHLHLFCPLRLYLLLFCSSTCPRRVHLSDPVTLAAVRQIASTPTGLNITLLSALLDQIALTVYQQTRWDSGLHSHERTHIHKQHRNTADNHIIITAFSILVPSPCLLSGIIMSYFCLWSDGANDFLFPFYQWCNADF